MGEAGETVAMEDEPEDDDAEELYRLVFLGTGEACPVAGSHFLCTGRNLTVSRVM